VTSLNLQPNTRGAKSKKVTSSTYRKFGVPTQKKKIKQTSKSKTNRLASNAVLGSSKMKEEKGLSGSNSICHSISLGH